MSIDVRMFPKDFTKRQENLMGTITQGPLALFVKTLAGKGQYKEFVETGTYHGDATSWAASHFSKVFTVEIRPDFQSIAKQNCKQYDNIQFHLGRSEECMPDVLQSLTGPAVFWLDAHAGGGWYADKDDCPLLNELHLISSRKVLDDIIIIDDARGFVAPPPPPFDPDVWPPVHAVLNAIAPEQERYIVIVNDMIICVPTRLRNIVVNLCNELRPTI